MLYNTMILLKTRRVCGIQVPLPRVEDLLVMKAVAYRPKDIEDMSMSDILEEFDKLLAQRNS